MAEADSITGLKPAPAAVAVGARTESRRSAPNETSGEAPDEAWREAGMYPCQLSMDVPLERFTVRDLLRLERGAVLETTTANVDAVPVVVNRQTIGWAVFEVVGQRLGVRITELA
jgi:flagellar motor switch/type III secretory pathway protein FliN